MYDVEGAVYDGHGARMMWKRLIRWPWGVCDVEGDAYSG